MKDCFIDFVVYLTTSFLLFQLFHYFSSVYSHWLSFISLTTAYPCTSETEWVQANTDLIEKNSYVVRGLPTAEKLEFRVMCVNIAGRSPPAVLQQAVTIREIVGKWNSSHSPFSPVCVCECMCLFVNVCVHACVSLYMSVCVYASACIACVLCLLL